MASKKQKTIIEKKKTLGPEVISFASNILVEQATKETGRLIGNLMTSKKAELHFNFLAFGKYGFINAKVVSFNKAISGSGIDA